MFSDLISLITDNYKLVIENAELKGQIAELQATIARKNAEIARLSNPNPTHTDNLQPWTDEFEKRKFSYWEIRKAWDDSLAGKTCGSVGFAFDSRAFYAFELELQKILRASLK